MGDAVRRDLRQHRAQKAGRVLSAGTAAIPMRRSRAGRWRNGLPPPLSASRRSKPKRVLEIGVGVGLLVQHLAPDCEDLSRDRHLGFCDRAAAATGSGRKAELQARRARSRADASDLKVWSPARSIRVILNSVVQYFPDADYLIDVLRRAVADGRAGRAGLHRRHSASRPAAVFHAVGPA